MVSRFVAVLGLTLASSVVWAQSPSWQTRFDAGWEAYQQGRYDEAERLLGAVEREARSFPVDDPRRSAVVDREALSSYSAVPWRAASSRVFQTE